jgi:small subunit ribosomal protein S6
MVRYETLILASPEITTQEAETLQKSYIDVIKDFGCQLVSFERWGKFRLAYPVKRNDYGVYYLARFEFESDKFKEVELIKALRTMFGVRFTNLVLRDMTSRLDIKKGLSYVRPESLEEQPSELNAPRENQREQMVDKFDKEDLKLEKAPREAVIS